jgi:hypothetical protein
LICVRRLSFCNAIYVSWFVLGKLISLSRVLTRLYLPPQVQQGNSWLTYGEPMHRLREFGVLIKEIDMLDSNKLSLDQIRKFCTIMYVTIH